MIRSRESSKDLQEVLLEVAEFGTEVEPARDWHEWG